MTYFCQVLCVNPSFKVDLTGYTALLNTKITQMFTDAASGHPEPHSLIATSGNLASEKSEEPGHMQIPRI